jgi:acyl dehydratase
VEFNPFAWPVKGPCHLPAWPEFCHAELSFSAGNEAEYHAPIRPGDVITGTSAIVDIYEKQGRAGDLLFVVAESHLSNQRGELVKSLRHPRVFIFQRPGSPPKNAQRAIVVPDGDPHRRWASQSSPGAPLAVFDDLEEGDNLPLFQRYTDLMNFNRFAAVNDEYVYHHMDVDIANTRGQKDVDGMGLLQFSYLHNLLRQWIGEAGDITRASVQYRANNGRGDIVSCRGRVVRKYKQGDLNFVDVDLWTENQRAETLSPGSATVCLPGRPTVGRP